LLDFIDSCSYYSDIRIDKDICEIKQSENTIYNLEKNEEYNELKELFKDDVDYKKIIIDYLINDNNHYKDYFEENPNAKNELNITYENSGIRIFTINDDYGYSINYEDIWDYLKLSDSENSYKAEEQNDVPNANIDNNNNKTIEGYYSTCNLPINEVMSYNDLVEYSKDELNKLYNEIFARHGHDFKTQSLKEYFNTFNWYNPIQGKVVSLEELTEIERENVNLIKKIIDEKKSA